MKKRKQQNEIGVRVRPTVRVNRGVRYRIQPKERPDMRLPYPFFIEENGNVGRQDFWRGKPLRLQGFNPTRVSGVVEGTIGLEDFFKDPQRAVGMYPIMEHEGGDFFTYGDPIESVEKL